MSADPGDLVGESRPVGKPAPPSTGRGCRRGCLLWGSVALVFLFVGVAGLGLPITYWHYLGCGHVFEGLDRVVVFIEVRRAMQWPGFLMTPAYNDPVAFFRIDVFPDGRVERATLRADLGGHITFNTNLYVVVRLADGFYLVENPGYAPRVAYRLGSDRIEPLTSEERTRATGQDVLQAGGGFFDLSRVDAISARRGWHRISGRRGDGPSPLLSSYSDPIDSTRHGVRLRYAGDPVDRDGLDAIVAESLSPTDRWARTLIEVDTRRWWSYTGPSNLAYLRARYAASPARLPGRHR